MEARSGGPLISKIAPGLLEGVAPTRERERSCQKDGEYRGDGQQVVSLAHMASPSRMEWVNDKLITTCIPFLEKEATFLNVIILLEEIFEAGMVRGDAVGPEDVCPSPSLLQGGWEFEGPDNFSLFRYFEKTGFSALTYEGIAVAEAFRAGNVIGKEGRGFCLVV